MPQWSEAQVKAIYTRNKNIIVSASAGAGKTTVLIARLVDLVMNDRIPIDRIVAMTFTEAAANEMKLRLAVELNKLQEHASDVDKEYIKEQLSAITTANICTIHSFCLSILKKYYYMIDYSYKAVTTILEDGIANQLKEEAINEVLQYQYQKNDIHFHQLCWMLSARVENNERLKSAIIQFSKLANVQKDATKWMRSCHLKYQKVFRFEDFDETIKVYFFQSYKIICMQYIEKINRLLTYMELGYADQEQYITILKQKLEGCNNILQAINHKQYASMYQAILQTINLYITRSPNSKDETWKKFNNEMQDLEKKLISELLEESDFINQMHAMDPKINILVEMCEMYKQIYKQKKMERECIDFDDMEHGALQILKAKNGEIQQQFQAQFDEIMVDEFQDTNEVQNELVTCISRGNNIFRVGDIKQSIYGFRYAKPKIMQDLIEHATVDDEIIYLSNNFRSKKTIVDFNNTLFHNIMNYNEFSCKYSKEDATQIGIPQQTENNYPVKFHALMEDALKSQCVIPQSNDYLKASYITNQIIHIKQSEQRNWKDFVVLVRSNAKCNALKSVFEEFQIPHFIEVKQGFYESFAIQIVLSTLQALLQPHDDFYFIACMTSPLFQFTYDEIADIKIKKSKAEEFENKKISFYSFIREHEKERIQSFLSLKKQIYKQSICETLCQIYQLNYYYDSFVTVQERTNLDLLYEKADCYQREKGSSIIGFMEEIAVCKQTQTAEAIPIGSDEDVVKVMSIHQSKGLQFPVVFLWSSDKLSTSTNESLFQFDDELGIVSPYIEPTYRYVQPSVTSIAYKYKNLKNQIEEELRILYVATTRAQEQLHIVDLVKDLDHYQTLSSVGMYHKKSYTTWILSNKDEFPNAIFQIQPVLKLWENTIQKKIKDQVQISHYTQKDEPIYSGAITIEKQISGVKTLSLSQKKAMYIGTTIHKYIESLHRLPWDFNMWEEIKKKESTHIIHMLDQLRQSEFYHMICTKKEVYYEYPFIMKTNQQITNGMIDCIAIDDEITIIDFKSDQISKEMLVQTYAHQLQQYKQAMQFKFPQKQIRCFIFSLALGQEVEIL